MVFPPVLKGDDDTSEDVLTWLKLADCLRARRGPPLTPPMSVVSDAYAVVVLLVLKGGVLEPDDDVEDG